MSLLVIASSMPRCDALYTIVVPKLLHPHFLLVLRFLFSLLPQMRHLYLLVNVVFTAGALGLFESGCLLLLLLQICRILHDLLQ